MQIREHTSVWQMFCRIAEYARQHPQTAIISYDNMRTRHIGFASEDGEMCWSASLGSVNNWLDQLTANPKVSRRECRTAQVMRTVDGRERLARSFTDCHAIPGVVWR